MINAFYIGRPLVKPGSLKALGLAALSVAVAAVLQVTFNPWAVSVPYALFFPAVIFTSFTAGFAAGVLAIGLSAASAWLLIFPSGFPFMPLYQTLLFGVGSLTVAGIVAVMRAATDDLWRLTDTLRKSEGKFRGLLECAPDAMVITDASHRIVLINARTEVLFGHPRQDLLGRPFATLLPAPCRERYGAQVAAFGADSVPAGLIADLSGLRRDGTELPVEISLGRLDTEAGPLVSHAIRDITARRQIEASLAHASKAKSDFLARMSHELRTPLNAIIGFSELVRDAVIAPLDVRYREYGGDINAAGRHLLNIVNGILDISKVEDGHLELREDLVSVPETIEDCRRIVGVMADEACVGLSVYTPGTLPLIRADQVRFRQILLNVMSNAVKFTPAGGQVHVRAACEAQGLAVSVEDTGIGMRPEDIAIALQPFRQIDGALSRRFEGTGLGLPLAKALTELHGGALCIDSEPGLGTTVQIRLPPERMLRAAEARCAAGA